MAVRTLKCKSCGGTYQPTQPDGTFYAHVCPEKIVDAPEACDANHNIITPATWKATPNPRNENLIRDPANRNAFVMVSEGQGVEEVK